MLNTVVWKLRNSCFQGPNIDDCKVSSIEYIHVYMHQSVTKIVMKKENLCKLLFFTCSMVQLHYAYM